MRGFAVAIVLLELTGDAGDASASLLIKQAENLVFRRD
jgi:hypothetical protein